MHGSSTVQHSVASLYLDRVSRSSIASTPSWHRPHDEMSSSIIHSVDVSCRHLLIVEDSLIRDALQLELLRRECWAMVMLQLAPLALISWLNVWIIRTSSTTSSPQWHRHDLIWSFSHWLRWCHYVTSDGWHLIEVSSYLKVTSTRWMTPRTSTTKEEESYRVLTSRSWWVHEAS